MPNHPPLTCYGTNEQRIRFLRYLRNRHQMTIEDIAKRSLYSPETVRSWFALRRPCHDRAIRYLLTNMKIGQEKYWAIVQG